MRNVVSNPIEGRLAASQPDREALKEFIVSASFASRAALDSDTIFCEIYTPGYQPAKKGSFGFFVKELRAILSLLSGASTKSDGVEGHAGPGTRIAVHGESGERIAPERYAVGEAGIKPGPSDTQLTKTPSADHDAGNLRGLAEPTSRDSSESTTGGAAPDHTTMEERGR